MFDCGGFTYLKLCEGCHENHERYIRGDNDSKYEQENGK